MLRQCLLACLIGLGCGVANGLYLLLVLHVISVARGVWRTILSASWLLLAGWPVPVVMFVVLRPFAVRGAQNEALCFVYSWVPLWVGALIWYLRTHPYPLKIEWGRRDRHDEQGPVPAYSTTQPSPTERGGVRSAHALHYSIAAVGCGAGLALYLLVSRRAFLHYYLAALGGGVGLALYMLLVVRTIRVARGRWRRLLPGLVVPNMLVYFASVLAFRVAGSRMGVADDLAAELGVPFLLAAPGIGAGIWYVRRHSRRKSPEPTGHGA